MVAPEGSKWGICNPHPQRQNKTKTCPPPQKKKWIIKRLFYMSSTLYKSDTWNQIQFWESLYLRFETQVGSNWPLYLICLISILLKSILFGSIMIDYSIWPLSPLNVDVIFTQHFIWNCSQLVILIHVCTEDWFVNKDNSIWYTFNLSPPINKSNSSVGRELDP